MSDGTDLEHHDADGVGDDVVEFAGNPRALLCNRYASGRLALTLSSNCADLGGFGLLGTFAECVAGDPGGHVPEGEKDVQARRLLAGNVMDDGQHRSTHDREAEPSLLAVAQIAKQERRRQPDDAQAVDERDERSVDDRDDDGQEPIGSCGTKGKAATPEERQHENRHRRDREPERRARRSRRVAIDDQLEHGGDRQECDQQLEPVLPREMPDPGHALKVLHVPSHRLLPE